VAALVRQMSPAQRVRLIELAPELRREAVTVAGTQATVMDYFERRMYQVLRETSSDADALFIKGYTLDEFCRLSEEKQIELWDLAHAQAEQELGDREYPVRPDALPAG